MKCHWYTQTTSVVVDLAILYLQIFIPPSVRGVETNSTVKTINLPPPGHPIVSAMFCSLGIGAGVAPYSKITLDIGQQYTLFTSTPTRPRYFNPLPLHSLGKCFTVRILLELLIHPNYERSTCCQPAVHYFQSFETTIDPWVEKKTMEHGGGGDPIYPGSMLDLFRSVLPPTSLSRRRTIQPKRDIQVTTTPLVDPLYIYVGTTEVAQPSTFALIKQVLRCWEIIEEADTRNQRARQSTCSPLAQDILTNTCLVLKINHGNNSQTPLAGRRFSSAGLCFLRIGAGVTP